MSAFEGIRCLGCANLIPGGGYALYCMACRNERALQKQTLDMNASANENKILFSKLLSTIQDIQYNSQVDRFHSNQQITSTPTTFTKSKPIKWTPMSEEEESEFESKRQDYIEREKKKARKIFILSCIAEIIFFATIIAVPTYSLYYLWKLITG